MGWEKKRYKDIIKKVKCKIVSYRWNVNERLKRREHVSVNITLCYLTTFNFKHLMSTGNIFVMILDF